MSNAECFKVSGAFWARTVKMNHSFGFSDIFFRLCETTKKPSELIPLKFDCMT